MTEHISAYIKEIDQLYQNGNTTEHSFRPALQRLLQDCTGYTVINEQRHIDCGAPDLTLLSKQLPIAYVEAKYLDDGDLDGRKKNREQFDRYKASLDTIIFTDYLDFHLYERGEWQQSVRLAEIQGNKIRLSDTPRFASLMEHLKAARPQRISSAKNLAQIMAGKARLLRDIIEQALMLDGDTPTELRGYMEAFQQVLIHDITPKQFADLYAQTIAYGMFAARLHDTTPQDFTRSEAANLIPKSNPFLRKVFQQIAGYDLDDRIAWIVDDLVVAFAASDMEKVMQGFGKNTGLSDPILHFYENFLDKYDPKLKIKLGVFYTPQPVVEFMVRAVDDILRTDFGLPMGLADTSRASGQPRVQILDPATGTGTFLAETVRQIKRNLGGQMGAWASYVTDHLLPRLHGFELMMAPYTIAHLKLDMEIMEAIATPQSHATAGSQSHAQRLRVFLTNSLEETIPPDGPLFAFELAQEALQAAEIKKNSPVMIVMGNPPYSGASKNKGKWITELMKDYKKEPGSVTPLQERNPKWINDDYCKFIRIGQYYVDRNKEGVLAYICNNGFLDNPTFRGMRWNLLQSFDKIYIINLHGNNKKEETAPDGSTDENVFNITIGTSINIFVKTGKKKKKDLADVYYADLYGSKQNKYNFLQNNALKSIPFTKLNYQKPLYEFIHKDFAKKKEYNLGFKVSEIFNLCLLGANSHRDDFAVCYNEIEAQKHIDDFNNKNITNEEIRNIYKLCDNRDWNIADARKIMTGKETPVKCIYRPFDYRYMLYGNYAFDYLRPQLNDNLLKTNIALIVTKQNRTNCAVFISSLPLGQHKISDPYDGSYAAPLYLYPKEGSIDMERVPNLDEGIWAQMNAAIGSEAAPEEVFDYIYGVLHSPAYRTKYKEFLKIDFPRIPYPKDAAQFEHFRRYGQQLRNLHLMRTVPESPVTFPEAGNMVVEQVAYKDGCVHINGSQYFAGVPAQAWEFYIGGYQPAQKWLKDRKGRTLSFDDINHYRNIIAVLLRTAELMREIDRDL